MSVGLRWTALPVGGTVPNYRQGHSFTAAGGSWVLVGGKAGARQSDVHVLSQAYGRWTWKAPKCTGERPPQAANHAAWATHVLAPQEAGGYEEVAYLFVYGGMGERNASLPVVHCLDLERFHWRKVYVAEVPPPRENPAISVYGGYTLMFGGKTMPEGLRRDDLWIFDLRRADFSYGIPSQHASIAGASWKEVRCAQTPKARDASPFCVLGSQACFLYGGRTGFDGVDAQVLDDLWCFTGTWQPVKYKGTTPGPRARHSLIPISDHEIALVGGEGPDGPIDQVDIFVLAVEYGLWTQPHVGGDVPRRLGGMSNYVEGWAVLFGCDEGTKRPGVVVLHDAAHPVAHPAARPAEVSVATGSTGPLVDASAELALEDAETLLMHAKKEVLALEMKLHDALKQKSDCVSELARAREELRQDGRDLDTATEAVERAVAQVELEHSLSDELMHLADLQAAHLAAARERARQFESVITTGEGLRVVNGEVVKSSILQEELDELPEYGDLRREHQKQLKLLKEATSEADLHHFVVMADRADQLESEVRAITSELEGMGARPPQPESDAFFASMRTGTSGG